MEWFPTLSVLGLIVALPLPSSVCGEPRLVAPSLNWTLPVGTSLLPVVVLATVAVKVTLWPKLEGFGVELTVVLVLAAATVWAKFAEVLPVKLTAPAVSG